MIPWIRLVGFAFVIVGFLAMTRPDMFWYGALLAFIGTIFIVERRK